LVFFVDFPPSFHEDEIVAAVIYLSLIGRILYTVACRDFALLLKVKASRLYPPPPVRSSFQHTPPKFSFFSLRFPGNFHIACPGFPPCTPLLTFLRALSEDSKRLRAPPEKSFFSYPSSFADRPSKLLRYNFHRPPLSPLFFAFESLGSSGFPEDAVLQPHFGDLSHGLNLLLFLVSFLHATVLSSPFLLLPLR